MRIVPPSVDLLWISPFAEASIEEAARTCYKSEVREGRTADFIRGLINRGHEAMLEHASASFRVITDRGVTHELVRHRLASFAQESTRFVKYDNLEVIEPPGLSVEDRALWVGAMEKAEEVYSQLVRSVPPQIARSVLPTCTKTEIVMTANFREWRHVFRLRVMGTTGRPHPQIQTVMRAAAGFLKELVPNVFFDIDLE